MPSVEEALKNANTPLAQALAAGVLDISYDAEVTFRLYHRLVLPLDGYLFWVRADRVAGAGAGQLNASQLNTAQLNQTAGQTQPGMPYEFKVKGSLHVASVSTVEQEAVIGDGTVIFTTMTNLGSFFDVPVNSTYIGETVEGVRFSFGSQNAFYRQANLYHYIGSTMKPTFATQIVDDPALLDTTALIVSNSLPAWLAINRFEPDWPVPMKFPAIPLYPSFLSPINLVPPYGIIHIDPDRTEGLQMAPFLGTRMEHSTLAKDRVVVTLWGCSNAVALTWLDCLLQYSYDTERFGLMAWPTAAVDDKHLHGDYWTLAQKKRLVFEVSYNQAAMRDIARQMVVEAFTTVEGVDTPVAFSPA